MTSLQEELTHNIRNHPEKLMDIIRKLLYLYKEVKVLRYKDTQQCLLKLDRIINQIFLLRQISESDIPLDQYHTWVAHLDRIYQNCQKEKQDIQQTFQNTDDNYDENERTILTPWITDWIDSTLQEPHVLHLVRSIALPILFPLVHTIVPGSILVDGPVNSGKSYALNKIQNYLSKQDVKKDNEITWSFCTGFQFPPDAQKILSTKNTNEGQKEKSKWSIYIVDKVHLKELEKWSKSSWFQSWDVHVKKQPNMLFIILTTGKCSQQLLKDCSNYFSHYIHFEYPNANTLYNYLKKTVNSHYDVPKLKKHSYINLPIIDELSCLGNIADRLANKHMTCVDIDHCFQKSLRLCSKIALQENVVYQVIPNVWIPKNSFKHASGSDYKYSLVHNIEKDSIEWCSQVGQKGGKCQSTPKMFWNSQLFDTLPSAEFDRINSVYIDNETVNPDSAVLSVIASFPIKVNIFPHYLEKGLSVCYENLILLWISIQTHLYQIKKDSVINSETKSHIDSLITPKDLLHVPERIKRNWFNKSSDELNVIDLLQESVEPFQILYVESDDSEMKIESSALKFSLQYGHKKSSDLSQYRKGIPGNIHAEELKIIIDTILKKKDSCEIVQVQIQDGYSYYINFYDSLKHPIECNAITLKTSVNICTRVRLSYSDLELKSSYKLVSESDLDLLTEKYPNSYREMYREEEETWKMKPLAHPSHIDYLNTKYSCETKYYLGLYHNLLTIKAHYYAGMKTIIRDELDSIIVTLQNYLDYLLLIIQENDYDKEWNELWSMSKNHKEHERYHPPENSELEKVVTIDIGTDWMRNSMDFWVSPKLFVSLYNICKTYCTSNSMTVMSEIVKTWSYFSNKNNKSTTQWIYVKSTIDKTLWSETCALSHLLDEPVEQNNKQSTIIQNDKLSKYISRTDKSLFHILFRNAESIGWHNQKQKCLEWYQFSDWQPGSGFDNVLQVLRGKQGMWRLLSQNLGHLNMMQWLFAFNMCGLQDNFSYQEIYAHLLFPKTLSYWSLESHSANILEQIYQQNIVKHFIRQYVFVHKQVYRKEIKIDDSESLIDKWVKSNNTVSSEPKITSNKKNILSDSQIRQIAVFGLRSHHIEDCF